MAKPEPNSTLLTPRGVTVVSIVVNLILSAAKIAAGLITGSQIILADGLHSGSDLLTDAAVFAGLRVADRPADRGHHYGHRRFNTLVAVFLGTALLAAAAWIVYGGIDVLHRGAGRTIDPGLPLWLALASVPVKEGLFHLTRRVARRTHNVSLLANAWHHRTDAFSSLAAAAGLAGVMLGGPRWQMLDPITAVVLAAFLAVIALRILHVAGSELLDIAPSEATLDAIRHAVRATEGVHSYHAFRARKVAGKIAMDIHVQVTPDLTVAEGHRIASAVRQSVQDTDPRVIEVIVHVEPA